MYCAGLFYDGRQVAKRSLNFFFLKLIVRELLFVVRIVSGQVKVPVPAGPKENDLGFTRDFAGERLILRRFDSVRRLGGDNDPL